ncbi:hypothetical protein ACEE21_15065 [Clostridium baratii]
MKAKVSYSELSSILGYVNTILSDKTVDDKMKNVIFLVEKDEVMVVGYSALTFARTKMNDVETEGVEENWDFQVKSSELNKIIASYNSLYKTKVNYIEFEKNPSNNKIRVIVHEEAINEEDARLAQTGRFNLDNIPILDSVNKEIHMEFPSEPDSILSGDLLLYIDSLFPLMSNDSASSLVSKLNFSADYIFVTASYISSFFVNKLPDSFKGLTLGYSSVNFLKRLCEGVESIDVQRIDRYLCIQSGMTEAFLKYQNVRVRHEPYVKRMSTENGIVLDRLYLKDVLKRMMVSSQDGVAQMKELGLEVSNDGFMQVIPVNNKKGDVDNLKFKISVPVLVKTIVGDDSVFPDQLYLYFVKTGPTGYMLYVKDATGGWFSTIQVRV